MGKKLSVKEVLKKFDFKVVNKGKPNSRYITSSGIGRIGIELTTKIQPAYKKQTNPVVFGRSELNYFIKCSKAEWKRAVKRVAKKTKKTTKKVVAKPIVEGEPKKEILKKTPKKKVARKVKKAAKPLRSKPRKKTTKKKAPKKK